MGAYKWHAEFNFWLIDSTEIELNIPGVGKKDFTYDQLLIRFTYDLKFLCDEGGLTVMDWDHDVEPIDPETGFKLPDSVKKYIKEITKFNIVEDFTSKFKGDQEGTAIKEGQTCVDIRAKARVKSTDKIDIAVSKKGGGDVAIKLKQDEVFKARANFHICCCTQEGESDKGDEEPTSSWSSTVREYVADNKHVSQGVDLTWKLNADIGPCGKVKLKEGLPQRRIKYV